MMDIVHVLGKDDSIQERISTALLELLLATKTTTSGLADVIETFVFGQVLKFVSNGKLLPSKTSELWISICQASRNQWRHEIFWTSALSFAKVRLDDTIKCSESDEEILKNSVLQALESPSHFMRQNVLGLAKMLSKTHSGEELSLLDVALSIEETPLSLESIRHVSMQMRRLTTMYTEFSQSKDSWVLTAIRAYSFGLLRVNFAPLWSDVCSMLQQICQHKQGETHVSEIAFRWLENKPINSFVENIPQEAPRMTQNKAKGDIYAKYQALIHNAWDSSSRTIQIEEEFHNIHQETVFESRLDRSQALRLLNVISEAAEKKSKQLVPVLLNWISDDLLEDENTEGHSENVQQRSWNRKEKKELLSLFSKFSNPKALYKSQEVYTALLSLLTHADIEIQKHAFIAILTWKNRVVVEYKDPILQFFDEANFKEQISVFLSTGHGEEILKAEHRSEIMPIILRILYGRLTKRGTGDQQSNRKAVFGLLAGLNNEETECFLNIALGPLANLQLLNGNNLDESTLSSEVIVPRKQVGLLTMLKDMLETLGTKASTFVPWFVNPIIYCLLRAENHLISVSVGNDGTTTIAGKGIFKSIRLVALTCLINLFPISASFDWKPYLPLLFRDLISPRLEKLASETTQGVSSLLRLFATWANTLSCAHFLWKYNFTLLSRLAECVGYSATKDEVKCFILRDIFLPLIQLCIEDPTQDEIKQTLSLLSTYMLEQLNEAMNSDCSMEFLEQSIKVIVNLVHIVPISSPKILTTSASLLRQPARRVNFENKIQLLRILNNMIPSKEMHEELQANVDLFDDIFNVTCSSFSLVSVGIGRTLLCGILCQLATLDTSLAQISSLVEDLNSFSESRLEEPDFEKRTKAFYTINEELYPILSPRQWAPLISNALYYVKDVDELAIRASASHSIRRFIEAASEKENEERQKCFQLLETSILPAVETAIRKEPEIVRIEYLQMLAHAAQYFPEWKPISDLQYLRWGGDADEDEASFFNNILHIQHHRRIRAIKRLSEEAEKGTLTGRSISHLLVPLLERFIFDSTDGLLAAEASKTIGALAEWMDFPQYRILLKRYISYIHSKLDIQERVLKVLNYASTALTNCARSKIIDTPKTKLMKSLPGEQNLPRIISNEFLPPFYKFLQEKDESFVSRRIAAATIATRIMQVLPEAEFALRFPPLLIDTCGILRSRDQSSRDATRNVLSEICSLVGPSAIGFVVTELRRILHRGFFLHVLGFTVHSILESTVSNFKPGDLDYCVSDITAVIMDDIFGAAGQEKEVADYLKMNNGKREVKSRKSFDTMQLLATVTTLPHLIELVKPIQMLLLEQLGQKALRNVDELFRRIEIGVLKNASIQDRDILIFCYQIIQDAYNFNSNGIKSTTTLNSGEAVHQSKHNKSTSQAKQHTKVGKIVRFGLELVRSILKKHKDLKTPANISGFLPMIRDALNQGEEDIKMAAIRLFTAIIGVPVSGIDTDATQVIKSAMQIIQDSTSTNDELSQAALKLIAATLKERKSVDIPEVSVALLLKAIKPDLQVINHQGAAFNLIKAILSRKFIMTEVYELIDGDDGIAAISIRDHDRTTRDLARGVYFQFLMDYPQGKKRFGKQLTFLIHNLEYEYPEGRQSVMEALNLLLNKVNDNFVQDIVRESFWPVVSILINDNNNDCRTMAHGLVKTIFSRADDEWCRGFLILLRKMLSVSSQNIQKRTAIQCWTAYAEVKAGGVEGVEFMLQSIEEIFQHKGDVEDIWQLFYYAMLALLVICQHLPQVVFRGQWKSLWMSIWQKLSFPHSWVKLEATKAIWGLITTFEKSNMTKESLPLTLSTGLKLTASDLCDLTYRHLRILREGITPELASQTIENLTFLGECFGTSKMHWISTITSQPNLYSESEANSEDNDEPLISKSSVGTEILAIRYLFTRLSAIVRKESQRRRSNADEVLSRRSYSLLPRLSALQLLQCLSTVLAPSIVEPSLVMILRPLVHLTDTAISAPVSSEDAFNESYKELVSGATALIDTLQKQFGTSDFVKALGEVKENITEQREERRRKRKIVAVSMPEVKERRKAKKREKEKVRRKEKNLVARGKRRGW
jgi:U3 small nucleolar RNA-associated protein 20